MLKNRLSPRPCGILYLVKNSHFYQMTGRKRIQKIGAATALAIAVLLLAAVTAAWVFIPGYLKNSVSEFIQKKSGGIYALTIDKIDFRAFPFSVQFSRVHLLPNDSLAVKQEDYHEKTFYTFGASEIEMEGIELKSFVRQRKFFCREIRIKNPTIKLEGEELLKTDSAKINASLTTDIRPLFEEIKEVGVERIRLEDASFGFYGAPGDTGFISQAEKVSVDVLGFKTNSKIIKQNTGFFETEDVLIRINDFKNDMGDSIHILVVDTLLYSLKSTDIKALGFQLYPRFRPKNKNLFEVNVPEVNVKSRSIARFALDDSLKISYLEFKHPNIKFFEKENSRQLELEDINSFELYSLVQNHFNKLQVDSFYLHGAQLEIFRQPDTTAFQQQFKSIDIILNGFDLDSTSAGNREKLLHSDELEMKVAGYCLKLDDDEHLFRADSLYVSTFSDRIGAKKIQLQPVNKGKANSRAEVNVECDALNIEGVVLKNLYHTRSMPSTRIEVIEPEVHLLYHMEKQKQKKQEEQGLLFELVTDYLKGVYSNLVYIKGGRLEIENSLNGNLHGYFETSFNFSLTDFSLDSASVERTDKFFYATNFDLQFSDYNMRLIDDLHQLQADSVVISSLTRQVQVDNFKLQPVIKNVSMDDMKRFNRSELFRISVPKIKITGVDLRKAFFNKTLRISDFNISEPKIYFENFGALRTQKKKIDISEFYQLIFSYIEDFNIRQFAITNGNLAWINHTRSGKTTSFGNDFSASLYNFRLNEAELSKKRLLFSDDFEITIRDQEFGLSDSVHVLKGNEIQLSSAKSSIHLKNGLLFPLITSKKYKTLGTTFQIAIPELNIEGFDFQKAWYSQEPKIDLLELVSPRFQIYTRKGSAKSLELKAYIFPMPAFVESFRLNELKITAAEATTYQTSEKGQEQKANFGFDFSVPGIVLKNDSNHHARVRSRNILLNISDFRAPINEAHSILIDKINFNRKQKSIGIQRLKVKPEASANNQNSFSILAPEINFSGFDLKTAFNKNNFDFDVIEINKPEVDIHIKKQIKDTLEFLKTLDLYPYAEEFVNQIKVKRLNLNNAFLHFNWLEKKLFKDEMNVSFKDILLSENQPPSNLLNSREFCISTTNLAQTDKNDMYQFSADSLIYNSARHNVLLKNIAVTPLREKEKFPQMKGFQTDVVEAKIDFIEIKNIDEKRWLQENVLDAKKLQIGSSTLEIFRNKKYPFNHNQRPPWPQDLIKNIKQNFVFDSVKLMPSYIKYSELLGISNEPGYITFNDLTFSGGRISNIEKEIRGTKNFELAAQARLLNESWLKTQFSFNLADPGYNHSVKGFLSPMPLKVLNTMVAKSAPFAIEDGQLNKFEFDISFDKDRAQGELNFAYDNLKIAVLHYDNDEVRKAKLASFLANRMVINSKNPKGKELLPVRIQYSRNQERSILNYWWKSLYSGAKEVLEIDQ
ncbi:hypothetical protein [Mariniphaga anaerophila]|nr:hypothetical protein [Mariniphaga anaerophila]